MKLGPGSFPLYTYMFYLSVVGPIDLYTQVTYGNDKSDDREFNSNLKMTAYFL